MRTGDLVRFWTALSPAGRRQGDPRLGLLIEYHTWEKIASVLCDGRVYRVRAENVEKSGKKDQQNNFVKDASLL
jgi:hypothetical protein